MWGVHFSLPCMPNVDVKNSALPIVVPMLVWH
jgi:hypothetical protein